MSEVIPEIIFDYGESEKNDSKYGNNELFESWADNNIFFPITSIMIDPLYKMGFTPNMITIMSTIFTFLSIYYLYLGNNYYASISYLLGYLFDCIDGKLARKYSMGSDLGMALDCVSDNVSNCLLFLYILLFKQMNFINGVSLFIISGMSFLLSLSYGLNEAIDSVNNINNDNFYKRRVKQLYNKGCGYEVGLYKLFLFITKMSYNTYKLFFKEYDQVKIFKWLTILKHFGPGNYCLLISIILLII